MATQLLVNVLRVPAAGTLAPGASVTLDHGLVSNAKGVEPKLIQPDRSTNIVVVASDATTVTFTNTGAGASFANFRLERGLSNEVDADTLTGLAWEGGSDGPVVNTGVSTLYVDDATGSNSNDGLTPATAKKTIQAAVDAAGTFLARSAGTSVLSAAQVVINVAAQTTTENVMLGGLLSLPGVNQGRNGISIRGAAQTTVEPDFVLTAVSSIDPDNTIGNTDGGAGTVTLGTATWTPNAFRGMFLFGVSGTGTGEYIPIIGNTATTLEITRGGTVTAIPFTVGSTVRIVQPATIVNGTFEITNSLLAFELLDLRMTGFAAAGRVGPQTRSCNVARCQLVLTTTSGTAVNGVNIERCFIQFNNTANSGFSLSSLASFAINRSYARQMGRFFMLGDVSIFSSVFEAPAGTSEGPLGETSQCSGVKFKSFGRAVEFRQRGGGFSGSALSNCLFTGTPGGQHLWIRAVAVRGIESCTFLGNTVGIRLDGSNVVQAGPLAFGDNCRPIVLTGQSLLSTTTITGTGNAAQPLVTVNDGSRLVYTVLPTVSGGSSDVRLDGTTKAWADLPFVSTLGSAAHLASTV